MNQAEELKEVIDESKDVISTMPEEVIEFMLSYLDNRSRRKFSDTSTWNRKVALRFGNIKFKLTRAASVLFYHDLENIRSRMAGRYLCIKLEEIAEAVDLSCFENVQEVELIQCDNVIDISPLRNCKYVNLHFCMGVRDVSSLGNVNKLRIHEHSSDLQSEGIGIVDFSSLENVQDLELVSCDYLCNIDLFYFGNILKLTLLDCNNITSVSCLANCKSLEMLWCKGITDVSSLARVPLLKIEYCDGITTWGTLSSTTYTYTRKAIYKYGVLQHYY